MAAVKRVDDTTSTPAKAASRGAATTAVVKPLDLQGIAEALNGVPQNFFKKSDFNPFDHWEQDKKQLDKWNVQVETAVDKIVDSYHKGFNMATSTFSKILATFTECQQNVGKLQRNLTDSQTILSTKNEGLKDLWVQNEKLKYVLEILAKIEYVKDVPAQLEIHLKRKQYCHVVRLLQHTLGLLASEDLAEIPATHEIRSDLLTRKHAIQGVLIEELHRHLYSTHDLNTTQNPMTSHGDDDDDDLRLSISRRRRSSKSGDNSDSEKDEKKKAAKSMRMTVRGKGKKAYGAEPSVYSPFFMAPTDAREEAQQRFIFEEMKDSYVKNPEADSGKFVQLVVEALDQLNALASTSIAIQRRVREELKEIIEKETNTLKEKSAVKLAKRAVDKQLRGTTFDSRDTNSEVLVELVDRVFIIFTRVLRRLNDLFGMIVERRRARGDMDSSTGHQQSLREMRKAALNVEAGPIHLIHMNRRGDDRDKFSIEGVWDTLQIELSVMLFNYLQADMTKAATTRIDHHKDSDELSFSFDDSNVISIAKESRVERKEVEEKKAIVPIVPTAITNWIQPSPYNIAAIYRPVVAFTDQASSMIGVDLTASGGGEQQLRKLMMMFIKTSFLPRVEADVNRRIDQILEDANAFNPRELKRDRDSLSSDDGNVLLLQCVIDIADLLGKTFADMFLLPNSVTEYMKIIEDMINRFLDKCADKYIEVTRGVYSASRLTDEPRVLPLLMVDPLYMQFNQETDTKSIPLSLDSFFSDENIIYRPLYDKALRLKHSTLINDPKSWSLLALMSESLDWLAERVYQLTDPSSGAQYVTNTYSRYASTNKDRRELRQYQNTPFASMLGGSQSHSQRKDGPSHHKSGSERLSFRARLMEAKSPNAISLPKSILDDKRISLADSIRRVADRCLFTLRMEVHCRFFYYLKDMQSSPYWCATESSEPEQFVIDLNKDMRLVDDSLSKYFPPSKIRYVFGGSSQLITSIFIKQLRHLDDKRINRKGVSKISRNLMALQQNLTNIIVSQDGLFDRAREYYECLNLSEDDLHQFRDENPTLFSPDEYAALAETQSQARVGAR